MAYNKDVRVCEKLLLSQQEAAAYAGVGIHRLEAWMREAQCPFVVKKGGHRCVNRQLLEEYLRNTKVLK